MKILGLACSPRSRSNTTFLLDRFLDSAAMEGATIDRVDISKLHISPCTCCDRCHKTGHCVIKDDMTSLYRQLETADAIVMAAPIYFMAHCAQAKLLIDRCQAFWARKYILKQSAPIKKRRGVFISVGATHGPKVFAGAQVTMKWFFDCLNVEYWGNLLFEGFDERGTIQQHPTALEETKALGKKIVQQVDKL